MVAAEYVGHFLDNAVEVRAGVRSPWFKRELNQFCYSQNNSSNVLCTTQPVATTLANGNVTFAGNSNQYIAPYSAEKDYHKVLPNVGVSYRFLEDHSVYFSFAQGISAPRTDDLYTVSRAQDGSLINPIVKPETTDTYEAGYRFTRSNVQATLAIYESKFQNRIATSFDPDLGISIARNIGDVDVKGVDAGVAWGILDNLTYIGNVSYVDAEVQSDVVQANGFLPTKGKKLVETPDWQWFQRLEWSPIQPLTLGIQGKWVGKRYSTDVNDEQTPDYQVWDLDARWMLPEINGKQRTYIQLNVTNLFDEKYLGSITSQTNAQAIKAANGAVISPATAPRYALGAPRTFQFTIHTEF
jgi:iron complex outermembrane receptor protein